MSEIDGFQVVTFALGAEKFAVPVALVREILDYCEVFRIPNGPDYLLGLTEMRGQGVPTVDLRVKLGLARVEVTPMTRILVVDVPLADRTLMLGLVVDRVFGVDDVTRGAIEAAPDLGVTWNSEYIAGVVREAASFLVLIEMARVFSTADMGALTPSAQNLAA